MVVLFAFATFLSTVAGGLFALRHRDRLHLILGFTAGVILGVMAFDILPEMFDLAQSTGRGVSSAMLALAGGFLLFHLVEKSLLVHSGHEALLTYPWVGFHDRMAVEGWPSTVE